MNLSVCCFTDAPPGRLERILEPLRGLGCEVVLGIDAGVSAERARELASLADRAFRAEFVPPVERSFAWLYSRCSRDWILRIDGDEVVSQAFADALSDFIGAPEVTYYWIARRWLFPDARTYLVDPPWRPDYQLRLHRNEPGLMRVPGTIHTSVEPLGPGRYVDPGFYHLDLLLNSREARERKCHAYRSQLPGLRAAGLPVNQAYYLPESRPALRQAPVPDAVGEQIERVLAGDHERPAAGDTPEPPLVSGSEVDSFWARRIVGDSAYRARLELVAAAPAVGAGDVLMVDVDVANEGDDVWPWHGGPGPEIRLGYRWLDEAGGTVLEGRAELPERVHPGQVSRVGAQVRAPAAPGRYELMLAMVHEHVRWFGSPERCAVDVAPQRRVAVIAGYSSHRHVGDDAVVTAHLADLAEHLPDVQPVLHAEDPDAVATRFSASAEPSINAYLTRDLTGESTGWRATALMLARSLALLRAARDIGRGRPPRLRSQSALAFLEQLRGVDALLACSAGALTSNCRVAALWPHSVTILAARALGKPAVISSVGVGPFRGFADRLLAALAFRAATAISVRDRRSSPRALRALGVPKQRLSHGWDAAAKLDPASAAAVARALDSVGIAPDAEFAVVSLKATPDAARGPDAVAAVVDHLARKGIASAFLPMVTAGSRPDQAAAFAVQERLEHPASMRLFTQMPPDEVLLGIVAASRVALGARYHVQVFAAMSGVPGVALHFSPYTEQKMRGVADLSDGLIVPVALPVEPAALVEVCERALALPRRERLRMPAVLPGVAALRDALPAISGRPDSRGV